MNNIFYTGVVESVDDTNIMNNRYRVRVFGVHSELLDDVPTDSLPWAIALMQSSSTSGVGFSSQRYVNGDFVIVIFMDGDSKQQPMILGSYHGTHVSNKTFVGAESNNEQFISSTPKSSTTVLPSTPSELVDSSGTPVVDASNKPVMTDTIDALGKLKIALGKRESNNNYSAVNQLGYLGKYQFGAAMLIDLGYVKSGTTNKMLSNPSVWTGKNGIDSKEKFLASQSVQESAMDSELVMNTSRLKKLGVIDASSTSQEINGYLATSHLLGTGGARDMKNGKVKSDANGVTGQEYYKLGYYSITGQEPVVIPSENSPKNPARTASVDPSVGYTISSTSNTNKSIVGFSDPFEEYPKYINEQDTNRLARNQNIDKTIVPIKEESEKKGIRIANSSGTWSQSPTPYNTVYPYNQVFESESGHVFEVDDTPNNERLHRYHKSGTFEEVDANGTLVRRIVGDSFDIQERNGHVYIGGSCHIHIVGNASILVENDCNLEVNGNFNSVVTGNSTLSVGGDYLVKVGGNEHHSVLGGYAVDTGGFVDFNSGESTAGSLVTPTTAASGVPVFPELVLEPRSFNDLSEFETDDLTVEEAAIHNKKLQEAGLIDAAPIEGVTSDKQDVTPNNKSTLPVECSMFVSGKINISDYISPNFKLSDLTKGAQIPLSQSGLKDTELACNLKALATNTLEGIKSKFPDMIITSGLRPTGNNPRSQHPLGMAADMQFTSKKSSQYIEVAKYISENIPFDQLILEYRSNKRVNGIPTTWIHVSFNQNGNRNQVFTMNNDVRISNFNELKVIT